jgi:predicted nucleic acid-binding protein
MLFLDTSALVKLYVWEPHSTAARNLTRSASAVAVSWLAYPEAVSAISRRVRDGAMLTPDADACIGALKASASTLTTIGFDRDIALEAGRVARLRGLRGADSVHLATAIDLQRRLGTPVTFAAYDVRLVQAAIAEGLDVPTGDV